MAAVLVPCICFFLSMWAGAARGDGWRITLPKAVTGTADCTIVVPVEQAPPPGVYLVGAAEPSGVLVVQVFEDAGRRWIGASIPRGKTPGDLVLRPCSQAQLDSLEAIVLAPRGRNIAVLIGPAPFTEYRSDGEVKPYLFPLVGPTGAPVTRAYPMENVVGEQHDHPHQRSFWFTHGNVNGIDFWSELPGHGAIRETSRATIVSGPVLARLRTTDDWLGPDGKTILEDERVLTFSRTSETRIIDLDITLKATHGPVTFGDTKEGMFGLRVASSMDVNRGGGGKITSAEGLCDDLAWGKPSPWVDYTGPVGGEIVGIAILNHPGSFRYPTNWHVRTYGLFAANPFGWRDFGLGKKGDHTLAEGTELGFRYRVILHKGDTASARISDAFENYRQSYEVTLTPP